MDYWRLGGEEVVVCGSGWWLGEKHWLNLANIDCSELFLEVMDEEVRAGCNWTGSGAQGPVNPFVWLLLCHVEYMIHCIISES